MIEIHESRNGQFYFVIKAKNNKVIATSETYKRKRDCIKSANLIHDLSGRVEDRT